MIARTNEVKIWEEMKSEGESTSRVFEFVGRRAFSGDFRERAKITLIVRN
jgi:hypothetical protein